MRIIGIHTPETKIERDKAAVAKRAKDAELEHPILLDASYKNWRAWGNRMWPAVYIVDQDGHIRYWWFGELNWREAGGQKIFTEKIEGLLKEMARK